MNAYAPLGIRADALPAWVDLCHALDEIGNHVPCVRYPDAFFAETQAERDQAAELCAWCPTRALCAEFADLNRERYGVWAGQDRTPKVGPSRLNAIEKSRRP